KATELLGGEKAPSSISERNEVSLVIRVQKSVSRRRAPSRPSSTSPQASSAALIAPMLAPLMASNSQAGSSSNRSSAPQVNAPNAPPPCRPSASFRGGQEGRATAAGASIGRAGGSASAARLSLAPPGLKNANNCDGDSARPLAA